MDEWPAWRAKVHIVAGTGELDPLATVVTAKGEASGGKNTISRLAALAYSLLGGDPQNFIPLAKLGWETTSVLRRGLSDDHGFASAAEFLEALGQTQTGEKSPAKVRGTSPTSFVPAERKQASPPSAEPAAPREKESVPPPSRASAQITHRNSCRRYSPGDCGGGGRVIQRQFSVVQTSIDNHAGQHVASEKRCQRFGAFTFAATTSESLDKLIRHELCAGGRYPYGCL